MRGLIINKGVDVNPTWVNRIAILEFPSTETITTPTATIAAGGSLTDGTTYYYRITAVIDGTEVVRSAEVDDTAAGANLTMDLTWDAHANAQEYRIYRGTSAFMYDGFISVEALTVAEAGDAAAQLSAWTIRGSGATVLYWSLTQANGITNVSVYSDINKAKLVSKGERMGDGAVVLYEENGSGITGTVTVAYTADDTDAANTLTMTATATYSDDGTVTLEKLPYSTIMFDNILGVFPFFAAIVQGGDTPEGDIHIPQRALVVLKLSKSKFKFECNKVLNQSTWSTGTKAGVMQAVEDINDWIS